jgi:hypothetical protein
MAICTMVRRQHASPSVAAAMQKGTPSFCPMHKCSKGESRFHAETTCCDHIRECSGRAARQQRQRAREEEEEEEEEEGRRIEDQDHHTRLDSIQNSSQLMCRLGYTSSVTSSSRVFIVVVVSSPPTSSTSGSPHLPCHYESRQADSCCNA